MSRQRMSVLVASLWAGVVVLIVGGMAGFGWWMQRGDSPAADRPTTAPPPPAALIKDRDYYFFVRLVEFRPRDRKGRSWDSGDGSAPDADVLIFWHGNRIYRLPTRQDSLIATWDLFRVDVKQLLLNGGDIDVASSINAPIIRADTGDTVKIEIWDDDPIKSDLAWRTEIPLDTLKPGKNNIAPAPDCGIARLTIELIDRQTPLSKLVEIANEN